jgi:hypothetical protein
MLEDIKFDLQTLDVRALTPIQWSALKNQLIEQARQNRNAELRKAMAHVFAGPERLLEAFSRGFNPSGFWKHSPAASSGGSRPS